MIDIKTIEIEKNKTSWTRDIPIKHDRYTHVSISVYYKKEKASYVGDSERGYYLSFNPVKIEYHGSYTVKTGSPREGKLFFIKGVDRFKPSEATEIFNDYINDTEFIEGWIANKGYEIQ